MGGRQYYKVNDKNETSNSVTAQHVQCSLFVCKWVCVGFCIHMHIGISECVCAFSLFQCMCLLKCAYHFLHLLASFQTQ